MFDQLQEATFLNEPDLTKRQKMQAQLVADWKRQYVEGGDNAGIVASMREQGGGYFVAQQEALIRNRVQRQRKAEELAGQRTKLEAMNQNPGILDRVMGGTEKRNDQIAEIKTQEAELQGQIVASVQEELSLSDDLLSTDQRVTAELARQKGILEAVGAVFASIHSNNPVEKWAVDLTEANAKLLANAKQRQELQAREAANSGQQASLSQRDDELKAQQDAATARLVKLQDTQDYATMAVGKGEAEPVAYAEAGKKYGTGDIGRAALERQLAEQKDLINELQAKREQIHEGMDPDNPGQATQGALLQKMLAENNQQKLELENARAQVAAREAMARQHGYLQLGQQQAERTGVANDYGASAAEKLANQRAAYERDMGAVQTQLESGWNKTNDAIALQGRLMEDITQRNRLNVELLHEQAAIEAQIKQLKIDQNKEFMRSFMGAGPAEMLQKLGAFRMSFNSDGSRRAGLSQGAFFGMSPTMRQNYGQLNPQYTPEMIELKRAQATITDAIARAFGVNPKDPNSRSKIDEAILAGSAQLQAVLARLPAALETGMSAAASAVMNASNQVARALDGLAAKIDSFNPGGAGGNHAQPRTAQAGGLGGGRGFAGTR